MLQEEKSLCTFYTAFVLEKSKLYLPFSTFSDLIRITFAFQENTIEIFINNIFQQRLQILGTKFLDIFLLITIFIYTHIFKFNNL